MTIRKLKDVHQIPLGLDRFAALYVWALVIGLFSLWIPDLFLNANIARTIAGDQAITCMLAFALLIPVAAGAFDLSVAATLGFSACSVAWMLSEGWSVAIACATAVLIGVLIGAVNGFVVIRLKVDSFIATLGMSSVLAGASFWITKGQQVLIPESRFLDFGVHLIWGIPVQFFVMVALGAVLYVVIEHTAGGRRLFAIGGNAQAARLVGVRVDRIVFTSFVASATIAALAGVLVAGRLGIATYDAGLSYLLPCFSAVFLGSTIIKKGRVNVVGTFVAIYLLATGVKGLQLAGAENYVSDLFNGIALVLAVALSTRTKKQ